MASQKAFSQRLHLTVADVSMCFVTLCSSEQYTCLCRAEIAISVALLHDVIDDTNVSYAEVEAHFGKEIAKMVQKVSELSSLNQLLRRNRRHRLESASTVRYTTTKSYHNTLNSVFQLFLRSQDD